FAVGADSDEIPLDDVTRRTGLIDVAAIIDVDAIAAVGREDIPLPRARAADQVVGGATPDGHAVVAVAEGLGAGRVGADLVALHDVARSTSPFDGDAPIDVARDEVPGAGGRSADRVVRRAAPHGDAVEVVAQRLEPGVVGADPIPLDEIAR